MTTRIVAPFTPLHWQLAPLMDMSRVMLLTGSAGGGKSRLAAEKMNGCMLRYPGARGLLVRKAREHASRSMVYALRQAIGSSQIATYSKSDKMFRYANGSLVAVAGVKDEDQREALRSIFEDGAVDFVWIEEANAITYEAFQEIKTRLRGTNAPWRQIILTTNPAGPAHWIKRRLIDGGEAAVYKSSAQDNPHNPDDYLQILESLTGVQKARLVRGKWAAADGALWTLDMIDKHRTTALPLGEYTRIVVAVDPAVTSGTDSDETGMVVVGATAKGTYHILADLSLKASPGVWAARAVSAYYEWQADEIVAEVNNGGDMVAHTIKTEDSLVPVRSVRASRGKHTRAQPIASLYEKGKAVHAGTFDTLEDQLTSWVPGDSSPDRLDAMVWGVTQLTETGSGITVRRYA